MKYLRRPEVEPCYVAEKLSKIVYVKQKVEDKINRFLKPSDRLTKLFSLLVARCLFLKRHPVDPDTPNSQLALGLGWDKRPLPYRRVSARPDERRP